MRLKISEAQRDVRADGRNSYRSKMAELNYQVEEEGRDEAEVAEEFLKTSGLL